MKTSLSAYILCGGKSSRMQEEKGLVLFRGKSFVQWILDALEGLVPNPVLITGNPAYAVFQLETQADLIEDKGPLGGIYTALHHAKTDSALVLSCDIPKITSGALALLLEKASGKPDKITFLSDGKNDYPLIGIYPKLFLEPARKAILEGDLRLRQFVYNLPFQRIILQPLETGPLQNINTKAELSNLSQTYCP